MLRNALPFVLILTLLLAIGAYRYWVPTETPIFWSGFIAMLVFYVLIFVLGSWVAQRRSGQDNEEEVLLAGRALPLWVAIFTMSATWVGGGYINGAAEATYSSGLVWVQAPWGYALSLVVGGLFFAKKMRRHRFRTMLDPLEQRYGSRVAALFFLPALTGELFWTAAILSALGSTFGVVLGLDFQTSIIASALVAIAYTALGGLWAVALTDVVQMLLLLIGLALTLPFALQFVGGWEAAWTSYQAHFGAAASFLPSAEALGSSYWNWWDYALLLVLGGIPWQVYFQRVLSARDENTAQRLSILAGVVCLLAAIPPVMVGVMGHGIDWATVAGGAPANSLEILPYVMRYTTPGWVATIGLGAVAAAVMSSADSSMLSSASMASWNVYRPLIRPQVSPQQLAVIIKRCVWLVGIAALLVALQVESIYALWFLCSDFVYCLLFPALVGALFYKYTNAYGAVAGLLVAAVLRFGGGDATLGLPAFLPYPILDAAVEIVDGKRATILLPFRTFAMVMGLLSHLLVGRLTQTWQPTRSLQVVAASDQPV